MIDLGSGVRWERLTTWNDRDVEFLYTIYEAGGSSSPDGSLMRHNGREFGIVLTGQLGVTVGFEDYVLGPGDSIAFDSSVPHRLHNDGDEVATAIWIVLGRHHVPEHDRELADVQSLLTCSSIAGGRRDDRVDARDHDAAALRPDGGGDRDRSG